MGGSGSSGWEPTPPRSSCTNIAFRAVINSPQPSVINIIQPGAVLNLRHQTSPTTGVVVEYQGQVAGTLTGTRVAELINCLLDGYTFIAEVIELRGGTCVVEVRSA